MYATERHPFAVPAASSPSMLYTLERRLSSAMGYVALVGAITGTVMLFV